MNLIKDSITIRNAYADDAKQLAAWWNDGSVMAHAGFPNGLGTTPEEVAAELADCSEERGRVHIIEYAGTPIGEMNYNNLGNSIAEIGIKICDSGYQGKGIGRKALSMFIRGLFDAGYKKIILDTNLNNTRAQHVYETLGFRKVRVNIDSWTDQLGVSQSSVDYELEENDFIDFTDKEI